MQRTTIILCLAAILTLAMAGAALAAPPAAGAGTIFVYGEFSPLTLGSGSLGGLGAGAGINVGNGITVGGGMQYAGTQPIFGVFANLASAPFVFSGAASFPPAPETASFTVKGSYVMDLNQIKLGVGGGMAFNDLGDDYFAEANASIALNDAISLYGAADYHFESQTTGMSCGITYGF